jgi:hypothetical protein
MNIKVNGQTIEIFAGARVGDVLLKYWAPNGRGCENEKLTDRYGHEVGLTAS